MNLPILKFPDDRLRTKASEVETVDGTIKTLVKDMFETMYSSDGIGLAATQVNQHLQVVVMDVPESSEDYRVLLKNRENKTNKPLGEKHPLCFINPTIIKQEKHEIHTEGCYQCQAIMQKLSALITLWLKHSMKMAKHLL
jgi:peptide deformylase